MLTLERWARHLHAQPALLKKLPAPLHRYLPAIIGSLLLPLSGKMTIFAAVCGDFNLRELGVKPALAQLDAEYQYVTAALEEPAREELEAAQGILLEWYRCTDVLEYMSQSEDRRKSWRMSHQLADTLGIDTFAQDYADELADHMDGVRAEHIVSVVQEYSRLVHPQKITATLETLGLPRGASRALAASGRSRPSTVPPLPRPGFEPSNKELDAFSRLTAPALPSIADKPEAEELSGPTTRIVEHEAMAIVAPDAPAAIEVDKPKPKRIRTRNKAIATSAEPEATTPVVAAPPTPESGKSKGARKRKRKEAESSEPEAPLPVVTAPVVTPKALDADVPKSAPPVVASVELAPMDVKKDVIDDVDDDYDDVFDWSDYPESGGTPSSSKPAEPGKGPEVEDQPPGTIEVVTTDEAIEYRSRRQTIRLDKIRPKHLTVLPTTMPTVEEPRFYTLLGASISLSLEEKQRIIEAVPKLQPNQLTDLMRILDEEQRRFAAMSQKHDEQLTKLRRRHQTEWEQVLDKRWRENF